MWGGTTLHAPRASTVSEEEEEKEGDDRKHDELDFDRIGSF